VQIVGDPRALLGDGQLAAALVEAGVVSAIAACCGEDRDQFLVGLGESAAAVRLGAAFVGEEERAEGLVTVPDRQAEEVRHVGVRGGPALEAGVLAYVGEALGLLVVEHRGEDAVLARQRADGLPLFVADAVHDELGEAAVIVRDAERRVLGVEQFAGRGDDRLEDVAYLQMPAHREKRGAHGGQAGARSVAHGLTVPAGGTGRIGPETHPAGAVGLGRNALVGRGPRTRRRRVTGSYVGCVRWGTST
jgi:hypothetical protein